MVMICCIPDRPLAGSLSDRIPVTVNSLVSHPLLKMAYRCGFLV
jgi:hypothetical protein